MQQIQSFIITFIIIIENTCLLIVKKVNPCDLLKETCRDATTMMSGMKCVSWDKVKKLFLLCFAVSWDKWSVTYRFLLREMSSWRLGVWVGFEVMTFLNTNIDNYSKSYIKNNKPVNIAQVLILNLSIDFFFFKIHWALNFSYSRTSYRTITTNVAWNQCYFIWACSQLLKLHLFHYVRLTIHQIFGI